MARNKELPSEPTTSQVKVTREFSADDIDIVINKTMLGMPAKYIAEEFGVALEELEMLKNTDVFRAKIRVLIERQREISLAPWKKVEEMKLELTQVVLDAALKSADETTRVNNARWLLERFPEFSLKNVPVTQKQISQRMLSSDDSNRIENASHKLISVVNTLKNGNPNVVTMREVVVTPQQPSAVTKKTEKIIAERYKRFKLQDTDIDSEDTAT